jgi:hypothetical protein
LTPSRIFQKKINDCLVAVATPGVLEASEFESWASAMKTAGARRCLAIPIGDLGVPPTLRRAAAAHIEQGGFSVIVVTDSVAVRGVVTAVRWLGAKGIEAVSSTSLPKALRELGYSGETQSALLDAVGELMRQAADEIA